MAIRLCVPKEEEEEEEFITTCKKVHSLQHECSHEQGIPELKENCAHVLHGPTEHNQGVV